MEEDNGKKPLNKTEYRPASHILINVLEEEF